MATPSRWLQWVPSNTSEGELTTDKTDKTAKKETIRASSVSSVSFVSGRMDSPDPRAWVEDFKRWSLEECVFRDRGFQSTSSLHLSFCTWTLSHKSVPCRRKEFESILAMEGFLEADGLVYGLMLACDVKSLSGAAR
jgi:recombination DNA repair RAD52 pathway protein